MPGSRAVARGSGSGCWIAPSILAADFARLGEDVAAMVAAGADLVHLDVMDNHYVPNLTVGPMVCRALRDYGIGAPLDVHLMVTPVDDLIRGFADAGAEYISFHPEASRHVDRSLALIEELGCKPGLALNPASPTVLLQEALPRLAMVLLMTVNPGFGGQEFMPRVLGKIKRVREMLDETGRHIRLEVDGGIKLDNVAAVAAAGADTLVAGSALFGAPDYAEAIAQMRAALALLPIREA